MTSEQVRMALLDGSKSFRIVRTPPRPLGEGQVRVRIVQCGICDSDVRQCASGGPAPSPLQLGHEIAGEVTEVAPGVTGPALGAHVAVWVPNHSNGTDPAYPVRGLADEIVVDARHCFTADPAVRFPFVAEPLGRLLMTIEDAAAEGLHVVIVGDGFKALLAVMLVTRISNPGSVIVIGTRPDAMEFAKQLGATHAVGPQELIPAVGQVTENRGAHVAFELTGTASGLELAARALGADGKLVTGVSQLHRGRLTDDFRSFLQELGITHVQADGPDPDRRLRALERGVELLNKGVIQVDPLVSVYHLDRVSEGFAEAAGGFHKVVVTP